MHDQCPNCGSMEIFTEYCDMIGYEKKVLTKLCKRCEHLTVFEKPFHVDGWYVQIEQALGTLDVIHSLLTTPDASAFLQPRIRGNSMLTNATKRLLEIEGPVFYEMSFRVPVELGKDYLQRVIDEASNIHLGQQVMLAWTYAEMIIDNFLECVKAVDAKRWEEANLAKREMRQGPEFILRLWMVEYGVTINYPAIDWLTELRKRRNDFVHKGKFEDLTYAYACRAFRLLHLLLAVIGKIANASQIPVVDEFEILYDYEDYRWDDYLQI